MSRSLLLRVLPAAAVLLTPALASAHGIESSLERIGERRNGMHLHSHFSSGEPAADAAVRLMPPAGGQPIALGRTNAEGQLTFSLPAQARADWEIQVDAGPGHRDYLEINETGAGPQAQDAPAASRLLMLLAATGMPVLLVGLLRRSRR